MPVSHTGCEPHGAYFHREPDGRIRNFWRQRSLKNKILAQATGGRVMSGARDVVTVRAIDSISLEIKDGDRIGLVGHNGSGKTTLLRALADI